MDTEKFLKELCADANLPAIKDLHLDKTDDKGENILFTVARMWDDNPEFFAGVLEKILHNNKFNINHCNNRGDTVLSMWLSERIILGEGDFAFLHSLLDRSDLKIFHPLVSSTTYEMIGELFLPLEMHPTFGKLLRHPNCTAVHFHGWNDYGLLHEWLKVHPSQVCQDTLQTAFDIVRQRTEFNINLKPANHDHSHIVLSAIAHAHTPMLTCLQNHYGADFVWLYREIKEQNIYNTAMAVVASPLLDNDEKISLLMTVHDKYPQLLQEQFNGRTYEGFVMMNHKTGLPKTVAGQELVKKLERFKLNCELNEHLPMENQRRRLKI